MGIAKMESCIREYNKELYAIREKTEKRCKYINANIGVSHNELSKSDYNEFAARMKNARRAAENHKRIDVKDYIRSDHKRER